MPEECCVVDCDEPVHGHAWIAIAVDAIPTGFLELEVALCSEHYQTASRVPESVPVAIKTHLG